MIPLLCIFLLVCSLPASISQIFLLTESDALNYHLCSPQGHYLLPGTQLQLSPDINHTLSSNSFCLVSNTFNITLSSASNVSAIITCKQQNDISVGFGFYNVTGLVIDNINITQCGGPMPSPDQTNTLYPNDTAFFFYEGQSATLLVSYSSNITMFRVKISNYYGFAALLINPNNNMTLTNINIVSSNQCSQSLLPNCSGSGLILYFNNADNSVEMLEADVFINTMQMQLNINNVPYNDVINAAKLHTENSQPKAISAFAAGMTVIFSQGDYSANVYLSDTYWHYVFGGVFNGLAFIFSDAPISKVSVTITKSEFHHNLLLKNIWTSTFGIGCMVTTTMNSMSYIGCKDNKTWDILTISDSSVIDSHRGHFSNDDFSSAILNRYNDSILHIITSSKVSCKLQIHVLNLNYTQRFTGARGPFILSETSKSHACSFKNVFIILQSVSIFRLDYGSLETALNTGKLVFVNTASVNINGENNFFNNITGSVIQAYNSDIHLNGTLTFYNNKASHGAAIRFDSLSHLYIHELTNATFINNSAFFYGGAIYSHMDRNIPNTNPLCAIQVVSQNISQLNARLTFKHNSGKYAGNSIYISPLYHCQQLFLKDNNNTKLYNKLFYFDGNNHIGEISSVAVSIHQCSKNNDNTDSQIKVINNVKKSNQIKVYPGETIKISLRAYDLNGNQTYAQILTRLTISKEVHKHRHDDMLTFDITNRLPLKQQIQTVYAKNCTTLNFTILPENTKGTMHLHFAVLGYNPTDSIKLIQQNCPLGFVYESEAKACVCSSFLKGFGITNCDIDDTTVYVPPQSWLGTINKSSILGYNEHCPPGYCQQITSINIIHSDIKCRGNRMGWLCGQCKEGYSVVLGSSDCYICSNVTHIALTLTFVMLLGIVYVLVLFSLRLTIDLGTLGGFIFWINLLPFVTPSDDMALRNTALRYMLSFLISIKYHWYVPVCITRNLNELGKTAILYFFPLYFWLIVALIVLLSRYSTRIANMIVGSSVQVLATLMYISYSDFFSISLTVLTPAHIHFNSTNNSTGKLLVWFRDGSVLYGQNPYHIALLCVSIAVLSLFIIPFILVGLFGVNMLRSRFIAKYFRPFIDAIHGPYKERLRYWFGLRLVILSLIYIITAVLQGSNMNLQLLLLTFILNLFIITQAIVLPYKNKILNVLDLWFMVLLLVNLITSLSYSSSENTTAINIATVQIVLCVITYIVILMYHGYISISRLRCIRKQVQHCQNMIKSKLMSKKRERQDSESGPLLRPDDSFIYEDWEPDN